MLNKYGQAIVVFDGYEVASTKDSTHMRRNKAKFKMLGAELKKYNCRVYQDSADGDYLIIKKNGRYS